MPITSGYDLSQLLSLPPGPRATPLDVGFGTFLCLFGLAASINALWQWPLVEAPRSVSVYGIQTTLSSALFTLATAEMLVGFARRKALFWTAACWLAAAGRDSVCGKRQ